MIVTELQQAPLAAQQPLPHPGGVPDCPTASACRGAWLSGSQCVAVLQRCWAAPGYWRSSSRPCSRRGSRWLRGGTSTGAPQSPPSTASGEVSRLQRPHTAIQVVMQGSSPYCTVWCRGRLGQAVECLRLWLLCSCAAVLSSTPPLPAGRCVDRCPLLATLCC